MSLKLLKTAINRTLRIKKGMKHSIELRNAIDSGKLEEFSKARAKKSDKMLRK